MVVLIWNMISHIIFDINKVLYPYSEDAEFVVADLKNAGYNLAVISSMSPKLINEVMLKYGIEQGLFAGDTKFSKRDPELYKYFLEKHNLKAEDCLMVDDAQEKLLAAHEAGIKTCWLQLDAEPKREGVDYTIKRLKELSFIYDEQKSVC